MAERCSRRAWQRQEVIPGGSPFTEDIHTPKEIGHTEKEVRIRDLEHRLHNDAVYLIMHFLYYMYRLEFHNGLLQH
jgi:hypothetical protein